mmetsp:Transcript_35652/g.37043  ORF Transcript_35652/g.37043 Transcript_35652/m.37043 type:complete len:350 (-) Transcript_35652:33-1082(-)
MKKRFSENSIKANTVLIIYKYFSKEALEYAQKMTEYLIKLNMLETVFVEEVPSFKHIAENFKIPFIEKSTLSKTNSKVQEKESVEEFLKREIVTSLELFDKEDCPRIDLTVIIGGDGTTLWGNHLFSGYKKPPFLTFNLGTLGYLTYFKCHEYEKVFNELFFNPERIISYEKRSTLDVKFLTDDEILKKTYLNSLNDVIFDKGSGIHMIKTQIFINNVELSTIRSDGIMIATSTGSTAYSLSSGGPITHYDMDVLILNTICPHTLSFRPIIFSKEVTIKLILDQGCSFAQVGNDGINTYRLKPGEGIEASISDNDLSIIILDRILESPLINWKNKLIFQLGWSTAFKNN